MSVHVSSEVWSVPLASGTKLVALALADMANDERECWPSIASLEKRCGMQDNAIRCHLSKLVSMGILRRESRFVNNRQTSNLYVFCHSIPSRISGGHQMEDPPEIREGPLPNLGTLPPPEFREGENHQEEPKENRKSKKPLSVSRKDRGSQKEMEDFCESIGLKRGDGEWAFLKWEGNGWMNGDAPIKDWKATIRRWKMSGYMASQRGLLQKDEIDYANAPGESIDPIQWMFDTRRKLDEEEAAVTEVDD